MEDKHFDLYHQSPSTTSTPSAKSIAAVFKKIAKVIREQVNKYLKSVKAFSITSGGWTDVSLRKFIRVTHHFIESESLELMPFPCDLFYVLESHTWHQITNSLRNAFDSHIDTPLLTIVVTDNGANFVKMSISFLQNVGRDVVEGNGIRPDDLEECVDDMHDFECLGWRCVAHTMQLAVLDVLKENATSAVAEVIKMVRDISFETLWIA